MDSGYKTSRAVHWSVSHNKVLLPEGVIAFLNRPISEKQSDHIQEPRRGFPHSNHNTRCLRVCWGSQSPQKSWLKRGQGKALPKLTEVYAITSNIAVPRFAPGKSLTSSLLDFLVFLSFSLSLIFFRPCGLGCRCTPLYITSMQPFWLYRGLQLNNYLEQSTRPWIFETSLGLLRP